MERKGQQPKKARDRKEGLGDVVKGQTGGCGEGSDWGMQWRVRLGNAVKGQTGRCGIGSVCSLKLIQLELAPMLCSARGKIIPLSECTTPLSSRGMKQTERCSVVSGHSTRGFFLALRSWQNFSHTSLVPWRAGWDRGVYRNIIHFICNIENRPSRTQGSNEVRARVGAWAPMYWLRSPVCSFWTFNDRIVDVVQSNACQCVITSLNPYLSINVIILTARRPSNKGLPACRKNPLSRSHRLHFWERTIVISREEGCWQGAGQRLAFIFDCWYVSTYVQSNMHSSVGRLRELKPSWYL